MDKMKFESPNLTEKNIEKIAELFPNCITETADENGKLKKAINFEMLRAMLSKDIAEGDEAYEFTWVGKKAAIAEANRPIRKTLRPCPEESVDWDNTENLYIEGDNLEVLKLLQESYLGKVKMIYIDPPYNTGNDFIYRDNFAQTQEEYEEQLSLFDEDRHKLFKNTDSNGRFHSDWCSMIYSRLLLARNLLSDDGVIFISIDDNEIDNLKKICNEIFGDRNFIANLIWQSTPGSNTGNDIKTVTENVLLYGKESFSCAFLNRSITDNEKYSNQDEYYERRGGFILNKLDRRMTGAHYSDALNYPIEMPDGSMLYPGNRMVKQEHWNWRWSSNKVKWGIENGFIIRKKVNDSWSVYFKQYEKVDNEDKPILRTLSYQNLLTLDGANSARGTREVMDILDGKFFDYPKPLSLIKHIQQMVLDRDDIILDFFSGSATTAHAVIWHNFLDVYNGKLGKRKFIMVQLPEPCDEKSEAYKAGYKNICEIGKERIRRAGKREYMDVCSNAGSSLRWDAEKRGKDKNYPCPESVDIGFRVFKLDETNMEEVYYTPAETSQQMLLDFESNIKPDRTDLDLLFGCLLEWGLPLSMPYKSEQIDGVTVHTYNNGDLIACFDKNIPESAIKTIAKRQPLRVVFRDDSFENSPSKINVSEIFKMISPDTRIKVI